MESPVKELLTDDDFLSIIGYNPLQWLTPIASVSLQNGVGVVQLQYGAGSKKAKSHPKDSQADTVTSMSLMCDPCLEAPQLAESLSFIAE